MIYLKLDAADIIWPIAVVIMIGVVGTFGFLMIRNYLAKNKKAKVEKLPKEVTETGEIIVGDEVVKLEE